MQTYTQAMLELTVQQNGKEFMRRPIADGPVTIGRSKDNTLQFLDPEISRHHCKIEWTDGTLRMFDSSTNGTLVNGEPHKDCELHAGDRIAMGQWTIGVETSIDAIPIKTLISNQEATHVINYDAKKKSLLTEKIEFSASSPDQAIIKKTVSKASITIGHHASCDLSIADPFVSRRHCRITNEAGRLMLVDLGSTNGTRIDGMRATRIAIPPRGTFSIGKTTVSYRKIAEAEDIVPSKQARLGQMIGISKPMRELFSLIERVAPSDAIVCILGESGTGKELVARELHNMSLRRKGPLIAVNCGAMPVDIIESQLFGLERGAFTGALERSTGLFEQANDGTLFLDEIGEMPLVLQTRLLRAIENEAIRRVGGREDIPVDVRLICATNRDLRRMVEDGRFRRDLFFRIFVVPILLPPLRERQGEIPELARHILKGIAPRGRDVILNDRAIKMLADYSWPGNVRELKNTLMRALVLAKSDVIGEADIDIIPMDHPLQGDGNLRGNEKSFLVSRLSECRWNLTIAAKRLGIARTTLQQKIKRYGIEMPEYV